MKKRLTTGLGAALLILAACGRTADTPPAVRQSDVRSQSTAGQIGSSPQQEEVVAVAEALFSAMRTRDTTALRALLAPGAQIVSLRVGDVATPEPQARSASEFISSIGRPGEELIERMWDPRVESDGNLATLWAPYDFHVGDRFSHCGHDAFQLIRQGGEWRIVALTYTIQRTGCTAPR